MPTSGAPGNRIRISIVVPVYNVEHELPRCVDSLTGQTYCDIEVILVDDGSTDGCPGLCDAFAEKDGRIKVIHKANGGLSSARNCGRAAATGDYILYVDSDDWIERDSCERLAKVAECTGAELVALEGVHETPKGDEPMVHSNLEDGKLYLTREFVSLCIATREWHAPAWLYMYSTYLYRHAIERGDALLFKEGLLHEDMDMQPRLFGIARSVAYCSGTVYHYVERGGSIMTSVWTQKRLGDMRRIFANWKKAYEAEPDEAYRAQLLGHFVKCWLATCRASGKPDALMIDGVDWKYLYRYGLDAKERVKALLFGVSPTLYVKVGRALK